MNQKKLLVVEDESSLVDALRYSLTKEGYTVAAAADGVQALDVARRFQPDLIILDLMLPKLDGLEVCRILRRESSVPIIMLTAKASDVDKVVGLELGADDYITKPFNLHELLARIKAVLRRTEQVQAVQPKDAAPPLRSNDLVVDVARHQVALKGTLVSLKPKEFDLLVFLLQHPGIVFSRESLLERVWGYDYAGDTRTVDVHIRWLREKLEDDPSSPRRLVTVRGVGYKLEG
jgi:two-component system OmpR family response regulator